MPVLNHDTLDTITADVAAHAKNVVEREAIDLHGAYLLAMLANMIGSVMLHDPKRQDEVAAVFNRVFERAGCRIGCGSSTEERALWLLVWIAVAHVAGRIGLHRLCGWLMPRTGEQ